ncbi:MAG: hypothetical protein R3250_04685, partial [Melioribacteraceae bacterium]|nr:hypothetical protein [Melioribacteraceae bacterium]
AFDENTVGTFAEDITDLTKYSSLGPDLGEVNHTKYDDIDDFNGYSRDQNLPRLDNFSLVVKVYYVSVNYPETELVNRNFAKKIDVNIRNKYLINGITFSKIVGY